MGWVTLRGGHVFIDSEGGKHYGAAAHDAAAKEGAGKPGGGGGAAGSGVSEEVKSEKAQRAIANHKMVDKEIQRYAEEHNEPKFAKEVGGVSFPDSEPVDIVVGKGGVVAHGIELKTMVDNSNQKLTMDRYAQVRKVEWERSNKAEFHTVVINDTKVFNAKGPGQHDESQRTYYYRRGIAGSARVGAMHEVKTIAEVKALIKMPENKLPKGAMRTDAKNRIGSWKSFTDSSGKGFKNSTTGDIVRPKK